MDEEIEICQLWKLRKYAIKVSKYIRIISYMFYTFFKLAFATVTYK